MLFSAVSVLVVAQSSSEIPDGLMNNPVLCSDYTRVVVKDGLRQAAGLSEAGRQYNMQRLRHESSSLVHASEKN